MLNQEFGNGLMNKSYEGFTTSADKTVFTKSEDIAIKALFLTITGLDIIGNAMVAFIIGKDKRIQNTVNLLILHLSISDIVAGFAILPYLFIEISQDDHNANRGNILCGLKNGLSLFFAATTVNFVTLGVLSFSRYMLINHPTKHRLRIRKNHIKWIATAIWFVGIAMSLPNTAAFRYEPQNGFCKGYWPNWFNKSAFFSATVIVFLVPFISLIFTFVSTVHTLWFKASTRRLTRSNSVTGVQSSRKKVTVLLGMLIMTFLICWLPFSVLWILAATSTYFTKSEEGYIKKVRMIRICILIALSNTCIDPVIYAFGNRQIKNGVRATFRKGHTRRTSNVEPTNTAYE